MSNDQLCWTVLPVLQCSSTQMGQPAKDVHDCYSHAQPGLLIHQTCLLNIHSPLRISHSTDSLIITHSLSRCHALSLFGSRSFIPTRNHSASCPGPCPDLSAFVPYILLLTYLASSLCPTSSSIPSVLITYSPCFIH